MTLGIGFALVALAALGLIARRPSLVLTAVAASAPFATTAALTVGANSVSAFHLMGSVAFAAVVLSWSTASSSSKATRTASSSSKATRWLLRFAAWSLLITALAPVTFGSSGLRILLPSDTVDRQVTAPTLYDGHTIGMLAQSLYLIAGLGVALFLARQRKAEATRAVTVMFATGIAASTAAFVLGDQWPRDTFENFAGAAYTIFDPRWRGVFSEPSVLAMFMLPGAAYFAVRWWTRHRLSDAGWAVLALLHAVAAESGTAVAALAITAALLAGYALWRFIFDQASLPGGGMLALVALAAVLLVTWESWLLPLADVVEDKLNSQSAVNRFASDAFSWHLTWDTFGLGVGLGASRPSSFLSMLLSNVGLLGLLLFSIAAWWCFRSALRAGRPDVAFALFGLLVAKALAAPNLSDPLLWVLLGACLSLARSDDGLLSDRDAEPQVGARAPAEAVQRE